MSIDIMDKISLLTSPAQLALKPENSQLQQEKGFADRLERALAGAAQSTTQSEKARVLAESLTLQMLQTSLSLSSDLPAETQTISTSSRLNALLNAYSGNLAANSGNPVLLSTSIPAHLSTPRPAPLPSQLKELAVASVDAAPIVENRSKQGDTSWLDPIIAKASKRYGIDGGLIKAVIKAESNFNPQAVSHAGARGLMQLMPATARSLGVSDSFDPEQNVMAGTRFLSDMLSRYNGDVDSALAAYNWGPGNVDKRPDRLPRETRDYLVRVKQLYSSYTA